MMLVGHDAHLVEVYLGYVGIRADVDVFHRDNGEAQWFGGGLPRRGDDGGDINDGVNWLIINGDDDTVA